MTEPRGQGPNQEEAPTIQAAQPEHPAPAAASAALELRAAKLTDVGLARPHNEDYVDFSIPSDPRQLAQKGSIFLVADGMGGHQAGEVASKGAVEATMAHYLADTTHDVGTSLVRAFRAANQQLYTQAEGDPSKGGMGTTLVAAVILGRKVYVANVGDSRAYLINRRGITQITEDHSWVEEQVRAGLLNEEQARRHPQRNLVTRALGSKPAVEVDLFEGEITAGDTLLLCSDGLTGRVADQEIAAIVQEAQPLEAARRLVALANERGGNDNITVLIIGAEEATPTVRAPISAAGKPQVRRRSRLVPVVAVLGVLILVGAVALAVLAASGILRLPFMEAKTETPAVTMTLAPTLGPATSTTEATLVVAPTGVAKPTETLVPTGTAGVVGTDTVVVSPTVGPDPLPGTVTLVTPTAETALLTGVVTFVWDYGPGPLPAGYAFQLIIGQGEPTDPDPHPVGTPTRDTQRPVDLDQELDEPGDYFWTVLIIEAGPGGSEVTRARERAFVYAPLATPEPATAPVTEGG